MRSVVAAISILTLSSALSGCDRIVGAILGEAPLKHLSLEARLTDGNVVFTTPEPFAGISCGIYDLERARRNAPDVVRTIWRVRCPDDKDCVRSVRYADPTLRVEVSPEPLVASLPGQCYVCGVGGASGRGDTMFRLGADGAIEPCPTTPGH
jgi:hypothetical protein